MRPDSALLRQIGTLFNMGAIGELSDGQLLERFTNGGGEAAEWAFAALVERHGPMVLRVCRNSLSDPNDAQDAFQATFLILVQKARSGSGTRWAPGSIGWPTTWPTGPGRPRLDSASTSDVRPRRGRGSGLAGGNGRTSSRRSMKDRTSCVRSSTGACGLVPGRFGALATRDGRPPRQPSRSRQSPEAGKEPASERAGLRSSRRRRPAVGSWLCGHWAVLLRPPAPGCGRNSC
jgi:hypothetical protein